MSGIGHNRPPAREGWIAISRDLRDHWLVGFGQQVAAADPDRDWVYSRSEAWIDLLMECRYEAGFINNGGHKMELRAGELLGAVSFLANRWNWTPKTVRGFLDRLEADGMIARFHRDPDGVEAGLEKGHQKGKQAAVISVCNYSNYQIVNDAEGQAEGQAEGKQRASRGQAEGNNIRKNKGTKEQEDILSSLSLPVANATGESEGEAVVAEPDEKPRAKINRLAAAEAFGLWQTAARSMGLPVPRDTSFAMYGRKIASRMYEHAEQPKTVTEMVAVWRLAISQVERSAFLRGMSASGFRADLKFLCQRETFAKLIEGGYGNGGHSAGFKPVPVVDEDERHRKLAKLAGITVEEFRANLAAIKSAKSEGGGA